MKNLTSKLLILNLFLILLLAQKSFGQIVKQQGQLVYQNYKDTILIADVMPEFPGGIESLYQFLSQNLTYPESTRHYPSGQILAEFIIDSLGKVCTPKIIVSLHERLDEEVLRIVKLIPDWQPALHKGKPVSTYFQLPVRFTLTR